MRWRGDINFLNNRNFLWCDPTGTQTLIKWNFIQHTERLFPFYFFECEMEAWGRRTSGFSVSNQQGLAAKKSFAEAWERICLLEYAKRKVLPLNIHSSNGFAAGDTNAMAIQNSRNELIERAVVLKAWSEAKGWNPAKISSLKNRLLISAMRLKGWELSFFELKSNLGTVQTCLALHSELGAIFDSTFGASVYEGEEKLLSSIIKNTFFQISKNGYQMPEVAHPEDHRLFYSDARNIEAFDFLYSENIRDHIIQINNTEATISELIIEAGDFPAVARTSNAYWPQLTWGLQSITGTNKWPHPLA